jgi:diadenosine tetraphosphate (Ap4A) HIT family hydrolase
VLNGFILHPRLAADTVPLGRLQLSLVLLMNDATYPWVVVVPGRPAVREIFQLDQTDRTTLIEEIATVSRALDDAFRPDKLNVAALGNLVSQLHVHVVARFRSDPAWPAPIWGKAPSRPYEQAELADVRERLTRRLGAALAVAETD